MATNLDPIAQTFLFPKDNYPNGLFLNSISLFFATAPTTSNAPVTLSIVGTLNGYPNGSTLDHSIVTLTADQVKTSTSPQYLDNNAKTVFEFAVPVYIQSGVTYAFMLQSSSNEYNLWSASNGDTAVASSVKNLPSDATPSSITKISAAPFVGSLFLSQNAQTWVPDLNQSLMFVLDQCVFDTTSNPTLQFVVPKKLPQRKVVNQTIDYYLNANSVSNVTNLVSNTDIYVDAFNVTTTDFLPTTTGVSYSYNATLTDGSAAGTTNITPGKFGTPSYDDIYLDDNKGQRVLQANSNTSFSVYASLISTDPNVSPVISDAGLSTYAITWNINNCELSNSLITLVSGGSGYNASLTSVTINTPTNGYGSGAYAAANIVGGVIQSIYLTSNGSGYLTTPTVSIVDANSSPGSGASATITGETSSSGGPALAKYVTKKVVLSAGNDSGDLNVYLSAFRPAETDINVYYKILNRNDTQSFESGSWQLMTKINNCEGLYSQTRKDIHEYSFAPGTGNVDQGYVSYTSSSGETYTTFSQFALKIVLTTTDNTTVPFITDLRAIALPANVNTSV